jgi:hypothetical protein
MKMSQISISLCMQFWGRCPVKTGKKGSRITEVNSIGKAIVPNEADVCDIANFKQKDQTLMRPRHRFE